MNVAKLGTCRLIEHRSLLHHPLFLGFLYARLHPQQCGRFHRVRSINGVMALGK